jgi:hypothetical protein
MVGLAVETAGRLWRVIDGVIVSSMLPQPHYRRESP